MTQDLKQTGRTPIGFWLALACAALLVLALSIVVVAWAVRRVFMTGPDADPVMSAGQKAAVLQLAEFPMTARTALRTLFGEQTSPLLARRSDKQQREWVRRFPFPGDSGYLLFSGLYRNESASGVKLIRIADGQVVASWMPDWPKIYAAITPKKFDTPVDLSNVRAVDPVLLDDGDIIFSTGNGAARVSACSAQPRWVLNEVLHHSNDLDVNGRSVWSPSVSLDGFPGNDALHETVRNDALAQMSLDGRLLARRSFSEIAEANGLNFLLFNGNDRYDLNSDPIHMNQIRSARTDSKYWAKGDLLISLRNPNTVLLYRPSTNRVIWHQTGPWLHQHSADFINDHQISVYNNNVVLSSPVAPPFLTPQSTNEVMVFDFATQQVTQPFKPLLDAAKPRSIGEGRARVLPDGGLFLEETDNGRIMRFSSDGLLWSFVNDHDDAHIGALAWSSYLTAEEAQKPLQALRASPCAGRGDTTPGAQPAR